MKLAQSRTLRPSKMPSAMVGRSRDFLLVLFRVSELRLRTIRIGRHLTDVGGAMQRLKVERLRYRRHPEERPLGRVSKDGRIVILRGSQELAPQDDVYSPSDISAALPPAA